MKPLACLLLLVPIAGLLAFDNDPPKKSDIDQWQGAWSVKKLIWQNKDVTNKYRFRFVFKGNVAAVEDDAAVKREYAKINFKFHDGTDPKAVDLVVAEGIQKDVAMEAIYTYKENDLKLCINLLGKDRPTAFDDKTPGASIVILELTR